MELAGAWTGLLKDCRGLLDTARGLVEKADQTRLSFDHNTDDVLAADAQYYRAAKAFSKTPLAVFKGEGLKTGFTDGRTSLPWLLLSLFFFPHPAHCRKY